MPTLCSYKECTGCATCFAVCPQHAITMEKDIYGFLYPKTLIPQHYYKIFFLST